MAERHHGAEQHTATIGGTRIACQFASDPDAPPMVLLRPYFSAVNSRIFSLCAFRSPVTEPHMIMEIFLPTENLPPPAGKSLRDHEIAARFSPEALDDHEMVVRISTVCRWIGPRPPLHVA
jgi:hypothetical protein